MDDAGGRRSAGPTPRSTPLRCGGWHVCQWFVISHARAGYVRASEAAIRGGPVLCLNTCMGAIGGHGCDDISISTGSEQWMLDTHMHHYLSHPASIATPAGDQPDITPRNLAKLSPLIKRDDGWLLQQVSVTMTAKRDQAAAAV